jgi:hypothetical protein
MPIHNESDVQLCYERWGPMALKYCQLFLGDQAQAEAATQQGFLDFLRYATDLCSENGLPVGLMKAIVRAATNRCSPFEDNLDTKDFESCLRLLHCFLGTSGRSTFTPSLLSGF